ncbi:MAG: endonuclease III, partial [Gemmatimonadales bacterium]
MRRAGGRADGRAATAPRPKRRSAGRETQRALAERAAKILARLKAAYPDADCALEHADAWQLLVATILSAQCTDVRVNLVTPALFEAYPGPAAMAKGRQADIEAIIRSTGFFRNKAKNLIAMASALEAGHGAKVPRTMAELHALPGVGRKTANVVLGNAYGINEGITVDTHVARITRLLRLTRHEDPVKIEQDLMELIPREDWTLVSHLLISHGRAVCIARRPR